MRAAYPGLIDSVPAGDALERWLERWGGWAVAAMIHLAALAVFSNQVFVIQDIVRPKQRLSIQFKLPETPPVAPAVAAAPSQPKPVSPAPAFSPAVATTSDPEAKESEDISPAPPEPAEAPVADTGEAARAALARLQAAALGKPMLPPETAAQIREELAQLEKQKVSEEVNQARVKTQVHSLEAEAKGRRFVLDSDGGRLGAIRTLDVSRMPEEIVNRVFIKYHIQIQRGVSGAERKPSFLNAAVTSEGTFRNLPVEGPQDVFLLSPTAVGMMAMLETEALARRGFDPTRTRVREIQFGIIKNAQGEWDLGVTKLETEEIR